MRFEGFPVEALDFYEDLEDDNSKAYWEAHRDVYRRAVQEPFQALLADLEPEFGAGKLFRPYRDVRFSKDKTPYKTHQGAVVHRPTGGLYVQVSAAGLYVAGGLWHPARDQVLRLREAVADDVTGAALVALLDSLPAAGMVAGGDRLVRVPPPYPADSPRADLLRHKELTASRSFDPTTDLATPAVRDLVAEGWRALVPLLDWLERHVGPPR